MLKRLLFASLFFIAMHFTLHTKAQDTAHTNCGTTPEYLVTLGVTAEIVMPSPFPSTAIEECGKFQIYYYDMAYHPGEGFDDPFVGVTRRNTLCAVLTYIQSVYDFSAVPPGQFIRLRVDTSYTHTHHVPPVLPGFHQLGAGGPFYNTSVPSGSIVNGFVNDYLTSTTGTDPAPLNFHCDLRMNFDSVRAYRRYDLGAMGSKTVEVDFQNGLGNPANCQYDLYSTMLHFMTHCLGQYSFAPVSPGNYSRLDTSLMKSPHPFIFSTAFSTPLVPVFPVVPSPPSLVWFGRANIPYRIASAGTHMNNSYMGERFGSGNVQPYVMGEWIGEGLMYRRYTKEELIVGNTILGLNFNAPTFASTSASAFYYANKRPYCSKNFDFRYNNGFIKEIYYFDTVAADFILTNNISSSLVINLSADTSLHDDDGDMLSVVPESIINYRGCGEGGNNHNSITLSNSNRTITYTPRHNFYGRAQFGFTVSDGQEEGTFVLYTIDVAKGTNVSLPADGNYVLNGDFEEGTEVRIKGSAEEVKILRNSQDFTSSSGIIGIKGHVNFADCQPYSNGTAVRNSYAACSETSTAKSTFGYPLTTFPWYWGPWAGTSGAPYYHDAYLGQGDRYQTIHMPSMYNLADSIRKCRSYVLEFDVIKPHGPAYKDYFPNDTFYIGFTDGSHLIKTFPANAYHITKLPPHVVPSFDFTAWTHYSIPFTYCSDTPASVLSLKLSNLFDYTPHITDVHGYLGYFPEYLMDNVSIKEDSFSISIEDTLISPCIVRLKAKGGTINTCGGSKYLWKTLAGKILDSIPEIDVSPGAPTKYILTSSNGCRIASDTIEVGGMNCPCGPGDVFGDTVSFYTLSGGSLTSIPATANYYVTNDITLDADLTFKNANVLMKEWVKVTVSPDYKLTLDSVHMFTCPDSAWMWSGIVLKNGSSTSGRIEMKNNCLIEDAYYAILADTIKRPASGDIINVTNSVFNRNVYAINMRRAYNTSGVETYPITIYNNIFTSRKFDKTSFPGYPRIWPTNQHLKSSPATLTDKPFYWLSSNYAKSLCKNKDMSYMGVQAEYVGTTFGTTTLSFSEILIGGGITPSDANLFDNLRYGLACKNANLKLLNSHFINISRRMVPTTDPSVWDFGGNAVVSQSDTNYKNRLQLGSISTNLPNKFHDCFRGVYASNLAEINITNTETVSSHKFGQVVPGAALPTEFTGGLGMIVFGNKNHTRWEISNNSISNMHEGILVFPDAAKATATLKVDDNKFYGQNTYIGSAYNVGQYMKQAVVVSTASLTPITSFSMSRNYATKVFNGISIKGLNSAATVVKDNKVILWDTSTTETTAQYGIKIENTKSATLTLNEVSVPALSGATNTSRIRGFSAAFNTNLRLCSNITTNTGTGFEFMQKTPQVGTRWISNTINNGYRGFVLGSDIGDQGYMLNHVSIPKTFYGATLNKWTGFSGSKFQTVAIDSINTMRSKLWVKNITGGSAERPTINSAEPSIASFPFRYAYSGSTGSILVTSPTQWEANCEGAISKKTVIIGSGGTSTFASLLLADALGYDSSYLVNQWMAQLSLYELGAIDSEMRDSSGLLDSFMTEAAPGRFGWLTDIENALNIEDISGAQSLLASPPSALGRVVVNNDLVVTDYTEADYIVDHYSDYYAAYIRYLQNSMNATDTTTIATLAAKCPAVDGAVVYKARSLYQMLTGSAADYNDDSCMYGVFSTYRVTDENSISGEQAYSLYPNPNEGNFVLKQRIADDKPVTLKVYNSVGAVVYQGNPAFANGEIRLNLGQKAPGLYLVCIGDGKEKITCLRFTLK